MILLVTNIAVLRPAKRYPITNRRNPIDTDRQVNMMADDAVDPFVHRTPPGTVLNTVGLSLRHTGVNTGNHCEAQ